MAAEKNLPKYTYPDLALGTLFRPTHNPNEVWVVGRRSSEDGTPVAYATTFGNQDTFEVKPGHSSTPVKAFIGIILPERLSRDEFLRGLRRHCQTSPLLQRMEPVLIEEAERSWPEEE